MQYHDLQLPGYHSRFANSLGVYIHAGGPVILIVPRAYKIDPALFYKMVQYCLVNIRGHLDYIYGYYNSPAAERTAVELLDLTLL